MLLKAENYSLSKDEWEYIIDQYIFSERNRKILKRSVLDGLTYDELAGEFNLSYEQIKKTVQKYRPIIFQKAIK